MSALWRLDYRTPLPTSAVLEDYHLGSRYHVHSVHHQPRHYPFIIIQWFKSDQRTPTKATVTCPTICSIQPAKRHSAELTICGMVSSPSTSTLNPP